MSDKTGKLILKFGPGTGNHPPDVSVVNIHSYGVWIMIAAENRLKCIEFESYPTLARAPAADLFNMVLDDGLLVWPALGIAIPLDKVPYETIKNAWASDCEWLPIDVDLSADRPPIIEESDLWSDEPSTPESDLLGLADGYPR